MERANLRTIVLASASPRRKELLHKLNIPVYTIPANIDEVTTIDCPGKRVEELSIRKAEAIYTRIQMNAQERQRFEESIIVGADTIVVKNAQVLGKPASPQEAIEMLTLLSGDVHEVYSGIAMIDCLTKARLTAHRRTKVTFRSLTKQQIERYVNTREPMDKAGAYGIQGLGAFFVDSIEGCYFNVVGLSLSLFGKMITKFGVEVV